MQQAILKTYESDVLACFLLELIFYSHNFPGFWLKTFLFSLRLILKIVSFDSSRQYLSFEYLQGLFLKKFENAIIILKTSIFPDIRLQLKKLPPHEFFDTLWKYQFETYKKRYQS